MNVVAIRPAAAPASRVRVVPVQGDHLLPSLRPRRDAMIVADLGGYEGEGIYLFQFPGCDDEVAYVCERSLGGGYRLNAINDAYRRDGHRHTLTEREFLAAVRGKVIADLLEREPGVLRRLVAA